MAGLGIIVIVVLAFVALNVAALNILLAGQLAVALCIGDGLPPCIGFD